jgi:hypothetical protein
VGAGLGVVAFAAVLGQTLAGSGRLDATEQRLLEWLVGSE